ncbi:MAG: hypothetical protein AUJ41_04115 [Candidatus Pacebacteria bacterium CG1_02_43_31]|nr:hypothetical protein [Candidatus Pacearchaeota archaeon]NCQ65572.1 hypothetical protein [Candidatus Paceibacterota bacterium]OIO43801.1 MAG: hypothetical protein AUJ41_04115 [Candidatus Pacebacteria bacterium CG1_02_43_31]PIQ80718.1 MAG: hypothetical protein COV78_03955 [Candidatus Pacebacteria bacterium CG11_big_fil_rev_8_21_14_0_20_34_55]PJC43404.1 MAG: hypothetical protein CO039_04155 [Candidatus Pacebacteria bacterium CG_4_9_14_0_2_um_filter_34_50]
MLKKINYTFIAVLIISIGLFLRFDQSSYIPFQGDIDELAYAWAGVSYWENGRPTSWSTFGVEDREYVGDVYLKIKGNYENVPLYYPWLDHPPLLPIIIGGWLKLLGYSLFELYPTLLLHFPMILISGVTLFFVYKLSSLLTNERAGLLPLILLSLSPNVVVIQRMVIGENLWIPFVLLAIILSITKTKSKLNIFLISFTLALAGLSKISGFIGVLIVSLYFYHIKEEKKAFEVFMLSILIWLGVMFLYLKPLGFNSFISMTLTQASRNVGWHNPFFIFRNAGFYISFISDFWYYAILILGFSSFFVQTGLKRKSSIVIALSIFSVILFNWITNHEFEVLGWYNIPLFIFLSINSSYLVNKVSEYYLIFVGLIIFIINLGFFNIFFVNPVIFKSIIILIFVSLYIFSLLNIKYKKIIFDYSFFIITALLVMQSIYINKNYFKYICRDFDCSEPLKVENKLFRTILQNNDTHESRK